MAADLSIHIFEGIEENDLEVFNSSTLGSKYFLAFGYFVTEEQRDEAYRKVANTPQKWVGEVSWLKAALYEDSDAFVPAVVQQVSEIIGEHLPIINDTLIARIEKAFDESVNTSRYEVARKEDVINFLREHAGKRAFTVSW